MSLKNALYYYIRYLRIMRHPIYIYTIIIMLYSLNKGGEKKCPLPKYQELLLTATTKKRKNKSIKTKKKK